MRRRDVVAEFVDEAAGTSANCSFPLITAVGIGAPDAFADSATVQSTPSIYSTGSGSTLPTVITLSAGASSVTFSSVTGSLTSACGSSKGCISLNIGAGSNQNDADGVGAAPATSSNTGAGSISGISGPGAGYLVGVLCRQEGRRVPPLLCSILPPPVSELRSPRCRPSSTRFFISAMASPVTTPARFGSFRSQRGGHALSGD